MRLNADAWGGRPVGRALAMVIAAAGGLLVSGAWNHARGSDDDVSKARLAIVDVTVKLDFGKDRGQNFGTLFEARDGKGRARFGAGFMGLYNTCFRADRFLAV